MKPPELFEGSLTYTQDEDTCDGSGAGSQEITVSTYDGGGGKYLVIKSARWAFDNVDELIGVIRDASRRLGIEAKHPEEPH